MKSNKIQQYLCDVIHSQQDFWKHSNDITSPTRLNDIEEECFTQLCGLISDEDREDSNVNEETNAPTEYGKYIDECLNEASKHFFSEGEDKYSVADLFYAGVRCGKSWLEKQGGNLVKNGYTNNKDIIKYADDYSHAIWHKLMDNFKNIKNYHISCNDVSDIVLNAIIDTYNWLEKQGSEPNWCHHKVDLSNCSEEYRKAYYDGWNNCNIQHSQCAWSKEDEKIYQSIIDDTIQENQLDNEQINWFISLKKRIGG